MPHPEQSPSRIFNPRKDVSNVELPYTSLKRVEGELPQSLCTEFALMKFGDPNHIKASADNKEDYQSKLIELRNDIEELFEEE